MISLKLNLRGDGCWPELKKENIIEIKEPMQVALLNGGMSSGAHSVSIRLDLPDGRTVIGQTSARLFMQAARLIQSVLDQGNEVLQ